MTEPVDSAFRGGLLHLPEELPAGMPVMVETVLRMSAPVILTVSLPESSAICPTASSMSCCCWCSCLMILAPSSKLLSFRSALLRLRRSLSLRVISRRLPSGMVPDVLAAAPASSMTSMALSGRFRSEMYLEESVTQALTDSGV